ncbi:MAG: VOC family protein [Chitinophagales bacterium]
MNNSIYPCLWLNENSKEVAEFYCSVFKNSTITLENSMAVLFELDGKKFMALGGNTQSKINPSISITAVFETLEETNACWEKLIDGGSAMIEIGKHPWSERYGWLKDKYGMTWQITIAGQPGQTAEITPSFLFTDHLFGKAEEAQNLYKSVFPDSSTPILIHYPDGDANASKVMYSEFNLNGYKLIAMDGPGEHHYTFNEAVSLVVNCETQDEIDHYWSSLTADGGAESMCGWLKDKYGVAWQIVPASLGKLMSDQERFQRVIQEVMKMKKLDIAIMENA